MTVRDLLEMCNDASEIRIRIFDCNSEEIIFSDVADYEVCSYDLYLHNGVINFEFNIEYEPEEEE